MLQRKLDFENGIGDWVNAQNIGAAHSLQFVNEPDMGPVGRFEVRDGEDPIPPYGERSEVTGYGYTEGMVRWYYFKFKVGDSFPDSSFQSFFQFHRSGNGESPVVFGAWDNDLLVQINAGTRRWPYVRPIQPGHVYEILLGVHWQRGSTGWLRVNIDGTWYQSNGPTMFDTSVYHKLGIYRDHSNVQPGIVFHTGCLEFDHEPTLEEARSYLSGGEPPPPPPPPDCEDQVVALQAQVAALQADLTQANALLAGAQDEIIRLDDIRLSLRATLFNISNQADAALETS